MTDLWSLQLLVRQVWTPCRAKRRTCCARAYSCGVDPTLMYFKVVTKARALVSEGGALYYIGCGASAAPSTTLVAWAPSSPSPQRNMEGAVTVASYLASNPDLLLLHDTIAVLDNNKGLPEPSAKVSWLHALG